MDSVVESIVVTVVGGVDEAAGEVFEKVSVPGGVAGFVGGNGVGELEEEVGGFGVVACGGAVVDEGFPAVFDYGFAVGVVDAFLDIF